MVVCLNWDFWGFVVADEEGSRWVGVMDGGVLLWPLPFAPGHPHPGPLPLSGRGDFVHSCWGFSRFGGHPPASCFARRVPLRFAKGDGAPSPLCPSDISPASGGKLAARPPRAVRERPLRNSALLLVLEGVMRRS